jgi:hypothetical protein
MSRVIDLLLHIRHEDVIDLRVSDVVLHDTYSLF